MYNLCIYINTTYKLTFKTLYFWDMKINASCYGSLKDYLIVKDFVGYINRYDDNSVILIN